MTHFYSKRLLALALLTSSLSFSQNNSRLKQLSQEVLLNDKNQVHFARLKADQPIYETNAENFLNSILSDNGEITVKKKSTDSDRLGFSHTRYNLYYNNVLIHNSVVITHSQNGKLVSVNGDLSAIQKPVNTVAMTPAKALQLALQKVNAKKYKWENKGEVEHMREALNNPDFSYDPKPELILFTKTGVAGTTISYAYKINVYAEEPLYKADVIVDASTGKIVAEENHICDVDVPATANTKYSGTQSMTMDNFGTNQYRMREISRGSGIRTYDLNNGSNYGAATDFTSTAASWTTTGVDQAAGDAHWGAEKTYDYYFNMHNRNSIDGAGFALLSYVHYTTNYANAFWDGTRMTYGDGNGTSMTVLTALDVCGHEITHGLTENTANLVYSNESGALNESYSDIFGLMIENYGRPANWDWKVGADMTTSGNGLRNMQNPKLFNNPHTYLGQYWYTGTGDNGGVHTNSGVSNYWFYVLSQGATGTNDVPNSYTVSGIGLTSAANIAFRALTVYYTPSTNYANARALSIQAAKDLYGNCSNEVIQTTNAWYAVGVGPVYSNVVGPNFTSALTSFCSLPASVSFNNTTANGISYQWTFGDGSAISTGTNVAHTYTANGTYSVKLKATGCLSAVDSITKTSYVTINTPANPSATGALRCGTGTVNLSASGTSQLYWYASPSGTGTPINIGTNYTTPSLTTNTTYYVVNTSTNAPVFGAPTNTSIGTGGNFTTNTAYDIFDVYQPCTLKTAVVYATTAGNRTIELRNSSNAVITSSVINIPIGTSTVTLNFPLTPGTGYRLGLGSASAVNLYRNNAGAAFPYNVGGLLDITGTSAGLPGYFYFFYNWQVQKSDCKSAAVAVTATVSPGPSLAANSSTICNGSAANLTASGASTYSWNTGSTSNSIFVSPGSTTNYTVYGTTSGCTNSMVTTVNVNPNPTVTVNSSTVCSGTAANLTASGALTYSWSTGAGTSSVSVNPASTTVYTVTGTNAGCANVKTSTVTVNQSPTVTVNSSTICGGSSANLTASGAATYSWNTGATTSSVSVNPAGTTVYTVTGTQSGCTNVKTTTVTVSPNPTVSVNSATVCSGSTVTLTASGATTYSWNTGATTSAIVVSPSSTTSYSITGTSGSCSDLKVSTVNITVGPTVTVNSSTICEGSSVNLTANGASTYSWSTGSGSSSIAVSPTVSTSYTVTGANGSCTDTKVSNVIVNSLPLVALSADQTTVCTISSGGGPINLTGQPGGGAYSGTGVTGPVFNPQPIPGSYTAIYTYTDAVTGCVNTTNISILVSVCTDITQLSTLNPQLSLYPNPNNGSFTVKVNVEEIFSVSIYNNIGQLISEQTNIKQRADINLSNHRKGIYNVVVALNGDLKTVKVVIE
jgi:Zn-dependent metalloprotease